MTDPIVSWLESLGATKKNLSNMQTRMSFICKHFGIHNPGLTKAMNKKVFSAVRNRVSADNQIDAETFIVIALSSIEVNVKWDISHIAFCRSKKFYSSSKWRQLRLFALAEQRSCRLCGASPESGAVLHVDHILPRSIYPEYALNQSNLQVLCKDCNLGKGNVIHNKF